MRLVDQNVIQQTSRHYYTIRKACWMEIKDTAYSVQDVVSQKRIVEASFI